MHESEDIYDTISLEGEANEIIKGAAYYVYDKIPTKSFICKLPGCIRPNSKTVTFYTYNGKPIITIEHKQNFKLLKLTLDPEAPKIRPRSFKRINIIL